MPQFNKTFILPLLAAGCWLVSACAQAHTEAVGTQMAEVQQPSASAGKRSRDLAQHRAFSPEQVQALLPAGSRVVRDIAVKQVGAHHLKLDLYLPASANRTPVVVWVHGGGWRQGQKEDVLRNPRLLHALLAEGYAVAAVAYRVSGQATFPAPIQDVNDAIQAVWQNSSQYSLDPERIALAGRSAGAHLAQ